MMFMRLLIFELCIDNLLVFTALYCDLVELFETNKNIFICFEFRYIFIIFGIV